MFSLLSSIFFLTTVENELKILEIANGLYTILKILLSINMDLISLEMLTSLFVISFISFHVNFGLYTTLLTINTIFEKNLFW